MKLSEFDYVLPDALIAQEPLTKRSASRLMVLDRSGQRIAHDMFSHLPDLLRQGDLLVRNDTRVIPARLYGKKASGGDIEVLLVEERDPATNLWRCMTRSSRPPKVGGRIDFPGELEAEVVALTEDGHRDLRFVAPGDFMATLERVGRMPLPPYIKRDDRPLDHDRYQTVFAERPGAVAAPTAGLHFTAETFAALADRGVETCSITLHVGPGTFRPVRCEDLRGHRMHRERYAIGETAAAMINAALDDGRRVVALGTTVTRTLEHAVDDNGRVAAGAGTTGLFILPGYAFRVIDALITNFHLPQSTLLMLVAAFAGREFVLNAYREAIAREYRFFSYGDCMLIQ